MENEEIKLIDYQIIALGLFLISIVVSIIVLYDQKQDLLHGERLFSQEIDRYATLISKILLVLLTIFFIYVNYKDAQIGRCKGKDMSLYNEQMLAAIFSFLAALFVLDAVLKSFQQGSLSSTENPEI